VTSPLVHLVCGSTGAGKTTYAKALAEQFGAVTFSIDQWMAALFWMDSSMPIDPAWAMVRVGRCYDQIWTIAAQVAGRGTPVVLDLGFSKAADRRRFAGLAAQAGLEVELHFLDVPAEARWTRVGRRNADKSETNQLPFDVTREMFDYVEGLWEPPSAQEMADLNGRRISLEPQDPSRSRAAPAGGSRSAPAR
jgi:predicted kinase